MDDAEKNYCMDCGCEIEEDEYWCDTCLENAYEYESTDEVA